MPARSHSTTTGAFIMGAPDDVNSGGGGLWIAQTHDTVSSTSAGSLLQGTLSGAPGDFIPGTGVDSLTDTAGGSSFFGDGGADSINLGDGGNSVFFGEFFLNFNGGGAAGQPVEAGGQAALGFWGATSNVQDIWGSPGAIFGTASVGGNSTDMATINGFTVSGATHDNVTFDVLSWNNGNHFGGGLDNAFTLATIPATTTPTAFNVGFAGELISTSADLVLYNVLSAGPLTDAADLATALHTETVGNMLVGAGGGAIPGHTIVDILVAYNTSTGVNIADVELQNTGNGGSDRYRQRERGGPRHGLGAHNGHHDDPARPQPERRPLQSRLSRFRYERYAAGASAPAVFLLGEAARPRCRANVKRFTVPTIQERRRAK